MRATTFIRPALSAAVTACLVLPVSESRPAEEPVPVAYRPNVALTASSATLPPPLTVVYRRAVESVSTPAPRVIAAAAAPDDDIDADGVGDTPATPLTPIDFVDALAAAGYLLVAGPLLVVSIPLQLISGQSDAVITSLNDLISAANTILKLVGRSIPPIPTPSSGDVAAGPVEEVDDPGLDDADLEDADVADRAAVEAEPEPETSDEQDEKPKYTEDINDTEEPEVTEEPEDTEESDVTEEPDVTDETDADKTDTSESEVSDADSGTEAE